MIMKEISLKNMSIKRKKQRKLLRVSKKGKNGETIDKDQLVAMIMDSSLHFDNVQGEYTLMESWMNVPIEVTYAADMENLKGMYYKKNEVLDYTVFSYGETRKTVMFDEMKKNI